MKNLILLLAVLFSVSAFAQKGLYNVNKKDVAINGYDVVSYFDGEPKKGDKNLEIEYEGIKYHFSSNENLEKFKNNPSAFMPAYGGYCAYAVAKTGTKVSINPKTFEIRDGKLYLFYNSWGNNTLKSWLKEGADTLKDKADENWDEIIEKI